MCMCVYVCVCVAPLSRDTAMERKRECAKNSRTHSESQDRRAGVMYSRLGKQRPKKQ